MTVLDGLGLLELFPLGTRSGKIARGHGEPVREQVGEAQHDNNRGRELGADDTGNDGKRRDGTVDSAVDPVAEVTGPGDVLQPAPNGLYRVIVLHTPRQPSTSSALPAFRKS